MIHIISPAFNEEDSITAFCKNLIEHIPADHRVYIVDDGSKDKTIEKLLEFSKQEPRLKLEIIKLSRNFGHQSAMHAGISKAFEKSSPSDYFVVMDSDLQHPPRLIPQILRELQAGVHHVQMLRADAEVNIGKFKKLTSSLFYSLFTWLSQIQLPRGGSDFRGFSYEFVKSYLELNETNRFNRGLFLWMGFRTLQIPYKPEDRYAGTSKYSLWKMLKLGLHGITQFSNKPLIAIHVSMTAFSFLFCAAYLGTELVRYLMGHQFEPGWPTLVFFISFWGGLLAFGNLMTSLYIGLIFNEVKRRPIFMVEESQSNADQSLHK